MIIQLHREPKVSDQYGKYLLIIYSHFCPTLRIEAFLIKRQNLKICPGSIKIAAIKFWKRCPRFLNPVLPSLSHIATEVNWRSGESRIFHAAREICGYF
jgi:hypothetical protein